MFHRPDHNGQALAYVYFEDEPGRRWAAQAAHPRRGPTHRGEHREAACSAYKPRIIIVTAMRASRRPKPLA